MKNKEAEEVKTLADLKKYLEDEVEKRRKEIAQLEKFLNIVNSILAKLSFKPAAALVKEEKEPSPTREITIKSRRGETLAYMKVYPTMIKITIPEGLNINVKSPPFKSFFIRQILRKMQQEDLDLVKKGKIPSGRALEYEIDIKNGNVKEILIKNYRKEERINEIEKTIRWTLETILDKIK
ncbi:MAG: hypothetical protein J7J30_02805 [Candidatus Odinarchaeota archaeon]|nr:hypothetical protein [Candidatus Odinarchaeota archaeon]